MASRSVCLSSDLLPAAAQEFSVIATESSWTPSPPLWMPAWCTAAPPVWPPLWGTPPLLWAPWPSTPSTRTRGCPTCPSCLDSRRTWTPVVLGTPPPRGHRTDRSTGRTPRPASKLVSDCRDSSVLRRLQGRRCSSLMSLRWFKSQRASGDDRAAHALSERAQPAGPRAAPAQPPLEPWHPVSGGPQDHGSRSSGTVSAPHPSSISTSSPLTGLLALLPDPHMGALPATGPGGHYHVPSDASLRGLWSWSGSQHRQRLCSCCISFCPRHGAASGEQAGARIHHKLPASPTGPAPLSVRLLEGCAGR